MRGNSVRRHRLTTEQIVALAQGDGDRYAIGVLSASQRSKRRLQLLTVVLEAMKLGEDIASVVAEATRLLGEAEAARPESVHSVLAHPYLDNWASSCLRQLLSVDGADPSRPPGIEDELGYLTALAAAAGAAAGLLFDVTLPVRDGVLVLPTLGALVGLGDHRVRVVGDGSALTFVGELHTVVVSGPFRRESEHWLPVRRIRVDGPRRRYTVRIEDLDPYRNCHQWPPAPRLDGSAALRFDQLCREAWSVLDTDYSDYARGMRAALISLMPLAPSENGTSQGATSFQAYGSLAVSANSTAEALALSLIHEFQHMKLVAILDLYDLYETDGVARYIAAWRSDPRPVSAALHGVYAHLGVCDFWRRRRLLLADPGAARTAHFEFALWRRLTLLAVHDLLYAGELTALGTAFVTPLRDRLEAWAGEPLPPEIDQAAADAALGYAVRWRLLNATPDSATLARLVAAPLPAWLADSAELIDSLASRKSPFGAPAASEPALANLIRSSLHMTPGPAAACAPHHGDAAYLAGRYGDAARAYAAEIRPDDLEGWVRLVVATVRATTGRTVVSRTLIDHPGLVHRLYVAAGGRVPPEQVAEWLTRALP
ncbi:HEXXH motif domain-containing protein [Plantactinospora soyae]|uniref:HEXXH motif-containing protein n=1 Tax=Plantactinospora soyae TaxID=1544732 RepID=A0A927M5F5_9ACTN|nr:HEXXH motif domain-containing protein [Plantactinospora soyae]MBE1486966.1 HEXXH motif-containing protein [Plantactinospora soyae]